MNGRVAHRARLILGGLIVPRTRGPLGRERVTLQAEQVHLAHTQITGVGRSVWRMTTAAALGLYWHVFIDKRTGLVRMALGADGIPGGQCPYLSESCRSVHVMAVTALDKAFVDSMVVGLGEVSLRGCVASVAELWLRCSEQVLRFFGIVRGVTIQAADIAAGMGRAGEVPLLMFLTVTTQAVRIRVLPRHRFKTDDPAYIPAAFDMRGAGTMTGLATVPVVHSGLEVWSPFELVRVQILVAGLAGIAPNILC